MDRYQRYIEREIKKLKDRLELLERWRNAEEFKRDLENSGFKMIDEDTICKVYDRKRLEATGAFVDGEVQPNKFAFTPVYSRANAEHVEIQYDVEEFIRDFYPYSA